MLRIRKGYRTGKCRRRGFVKLRRIGRRGSFQFPSNGKAYPKVVIRKRNSMPAPASFNSLQTGKHIQRYVRGRAGNRLLVSIPFKRETISKVGVTVSQQGTLYVFQFPSNGKPYPKMDVGCRDLRGTTSFNSLQTGTRIQS